MALEARLNTMAREQGVDVQRLRRQVAFARFHVDVGLGDKALEPLDSVQSNDWLGFAGIPAGVFPIVSKEQQFAVENVDVPEGGIFSHGWPAES
jgi:hypothetical protein